MSDDDRWDLSDPPPAAATPRTPPPLTGPSRPPDIRFDPVATFLGVFVAVTVPIIVVGFARGGSSLMLAIIAVVIGIGVGLIAGVWVASRDGKVWRGPQL